MGLAASQGRLLLLTARKSDLELQAQAISQDRLLLSIQQEQIATEYSDKQNNQIYEIKPAGDTEYVALSIKALNKHYNSGEAKYKPDGKTYSNYRIWDTRTNKTVDPATIASSDGSSSTPDSSLQQNIANGFWIIQTVDKNESTQTDKKDALGNQIYVSMSLSGDSSFRQTYYTNDDAGAKAKYDSAMARVQRLDKQLETKLNQVETQHKSIETEVESVDKIISNNVEASFKYFS